MPDRRLLRCVATFIGAILATALSSVPAGAEVPAWVPDDYRKYFVRYVDDRSLFERALNQVGLSLEDTGRGFALVAGISRYPEIRGSAADLDPAANDVAKLVAYLSEHEFFNEIVVLENEAVTPENLRYFLKTYFPERLRNSPKSRFLFAYSGHGMSVSNRGYLLTQEARSLEDSVNGISTDELRAWFQEIIDDGHHVLALINACYGGNFLRSSFGQDRDYPPQEKGAHAITAGRGGELTWHDPDFGSGTGSIFFEALLVGLSGQADGLPKDGIVTVRELDAYLHGVISAFTNNEQNPQIGDLYPPPNQSPGGFFFLDQQRQVERGVVGPFDPDAAVKFGRSLIEGDTGNAGVVTWERTYGDVGVDRLMAIAAAADGGFLLAGETGSRGGVVGRSDGWLLKVGRDGRQLWERTYWAGLLGSIKEFRFLGRRHGYSLSAITAAADGGFLLAGHAMSGRTREDILGPAPEDDGWLLKVDRDGRELWRRTYGGGGDDRLNAIAAAADGGFLLAGSTGDDGWLLKVDRDGTIRSEPVAER